MSDGGATARTGAGRTLRDRLAALEWRAVAVVVFAGLVLTAAGSWSAYSVDRHSERRLLESQTRQAANGISAAIATIVGPLQTIAAVANSTDGDAARVRSAAAVVVGPGRLFAGLVVLRAPGATFEPVATVGSPTLRAPGSAAVQRMARKAVANPGTFAVAALPAPTGARVSYAISGGGTYVVYAERAIPANRRVPVESTSSFANLHFATYLGVTASPAALQTTDLPDSRLPITGTVARVIIPFGDNHILLVTRAAHRLGGGLEGVLWWLVALAGGVATVVAAALIGALVHRQGEAQRNARTITQLYDELNATYLQQRDVSETLQRALLPQSNPDLPGVDLAARYVAGGAGVEVGGDWFSVIRTDDGFGFVVGDVSGRGVAAAALMARLRFTVRAYLLEGHAPEQVLDMCSRDLDVRRDGHMATVLVGKAFSASGEVVLASAGHLAPLLADGEAVRPVPIRVGPPLGAGPGQFPTTSVHVRSGTTLLAFTDGLVERRDEPIETGIARLAHAAGVPPAGLDDWLESLLHAMTPDGSEDDIAMLALRWE